jgi:hypothetical protein
MEGDTILMQDIFKYRLNMRGDGGRNDGELVATGLRPKFLDRLGEVGVEIPAKAFRPPAPAANGGASRLRSAKVPAVSQLVRPERAR